MGRQEDDEHERALEPVPAAGVASKMVPNARPRPRLVASTNRSPLQAAVQRGVIHAQDTSARRSEILVNLLGPSHSLGREQNDYVLQGACLASEGRGIRCWVAL
jgi:hypothetical protein